MSNKKPIILAIVIVSIFFGWFAVRPSYIKHSCSWVKKHSDYVPARPAMTKEELIANGIIRSCETEIQELSKVLPSRHYELGDNSVHATSMLTTYERLHAMSNDPLWKATSCIEDGNKIINEYKEARPESPARTWYQKSTDAEYKFCLRDKGL